MPDERARACRSASCPVLETNKLDEDRGDTAVKVKASVKKICENCKIVRRAGVVRVICSKTRKHKQRQG